MNYKPKLELTWIGKGEQPKLEPRILIEDPTKSYGDKNAENMLIYGDNLLALKALEQDFAGKIKCIYIDPPYNTGSAFEHYDDSLEHSTWLNLMKPRVNLLRTLLREDGSIWISIDDSEGHYLKVLCDESFGRNNFVGTIIWEKRKSRENRRTFSFNHDYVLVYAKNKPAFEDTRNPMELSQEILSRYKNPDNDPRGRWQSISALAQAGHATPSQFYILKTPSGRKLEPPKGNCWRFTKRRMEEAIREGRIWFGKTGDNVPRIKRYLGENPNDGLTPETIWPAGEVGTNDEAKRGLIDLLADVPVFDNPKPEALLSRILHISTNRGDWVLDSFLGSGTTAAVAHKMKRKWVGIELGEHCHTHCIPRLQKVCDGTDQGGISEAQNWKGGGGFKYYYLAPSLLKQDSRGNWIISKEYNAAQLAAAMAKHEGFRFMPDETYYWKQGKSTEKDFIFTTTNFISVEFIDTIHGEMKSDESLLICCTSFSKAADKYPSITIKKIPKMLLGSCEFGKEDYSLNIINLPRDNDEPDFVPTGPIASNKPKEKKKDEGQESLFDKKKV